MRHKILLILSVLFISLSTQAQDKEKENGFIFEPDEDFQYDSRRDVSKPLMPIYFEDGQPFHEKGKKRQKQQEQYLNREYYYPAKPKHAWQLGLTGGIAMINGDINQQFFKGAKPFVPGYTFGVQVRKPFSYLFSMRLNYAFMEMWNADWEPSTLLSNLVQRRPELGAYYDNPNGPSQNKIFHNSHTVSHEMTLDAVFSFGNVRFHKERTKVLFNVFASAGGFMYQTWYDHLDDDGNPYDYSSIPNVNDPDVSKGDVVQALNELRNGVYETPAEGNPATQNPELFDNYSFRPVAGVGAGMEFRLGRVVNLGLTARQMFTRDDLLEGQQWQESDGSALTLAQAGGARVPTSRGFTRDYDTYTRVETSLTFNLVGKKRTEPLTWLNPMDNTYKKLGDMDPKALEEEMKKDDDEDGVPNFLDQEEDSECDKVDSKGRVLDSDGDGVNDCNDSEPYSMPGYPVDANGVADVETCCDQLDPDMFKSNSVDCDAVDKLPSIIFEGDKISISPENLASLHLIAEKLKACPDLKIVATGATDQYSNKKYNEQISWNRAQNVVEYMTSEYGIDRGRFIIEYTSEPGDSKAGNRRVDMKAAEGASGESNPAAPHPGINVGRE